MGLLIYADLRSVHQVFRVSQKRIDDAPTPQARRALLENKNTRDREEQRHQALIESTLAVDLVLFLWAGAGVLGWPKRMKEE